MADLTTAIISGVLLAGLVIAYRQWRAAVEQIATAQKQIANDHERSRRELSINLLCQWSRGLDAYASATRKFVEALDGKTCRKLFLQEEFSVPDDTLPLLRACLDDKSLEQSKLLTPLGRVEEASQFVVDRRVSSEIRWRIVTYLNNLESILSAWRHNVADKKMLEEQFRYLFAPKDGHKLLSEFREAAEGDKNYPSITEFAVLLESSNKQVAPGKPAVEGI